MSDLIPISKNISQSYCFKLVSDSNAYLTTFKGNIPMEDIKNILQSLQKHLFQDSGKIIAEYLMLHSLEYTDMHFEISITNHLEIMGLAGSLLHHDSTSLIDEIIGFTDNYYAIIDCQEFVNKNTCEGCYLAIRKRTSVRSHKVTYNIIGQTFSDNQSGTEQAGYFAIRSSEDSSQFYNIQAIPKPILPTFGCIDTIELLSEIDHIKTAKQALYASVH